MNDTAKDWRAERNATNAKIDAKLAELGITLTAEFMPASRFAGDNFKSKAINFTIKVNRGAWCLYHGPYAYGVGNLPGYVPRYADKLIAETIMADALERGKWPNAGLEVLRPGARPYFPSSPVPAPLLRDVMHSLLMDSSAIDHPSFESWASDYGYDTDSRSAEKTYRACLETGLQMRAGLGNAVLAELRELFQDY